MARLRALQADVDAAIAHARAAVDRLNDAIVVEEVEHFLFDGLPLEEPMPKLPFRNAPSPAESVRALFEAETTIGFRLSGALEERLSLESNVGDVTLDALLEGNDGDLGASARQLTDVDRMVDSLLAAEETARDRRRAAIRAVFAEEAAMKRREAAEKRKAAEKHSQRTAELLAGLREHEGCEYVPASPSTVRSAIGISGGAPVVITVNIPRSQFLMNEAAALDVEANRIEGRPPKENGAIMNVTRPELQERLSSLDPMVIGPRALAVFEWLRKTEGPVLASLEGASDPLHVRHGSEVRYDLAWRNGEVDTAASKVYLWQPDFVKNPAQTEARAARSAWNREHEFRG